MLELSLVHLHANCLESLFFFVSPLMLFHPSTHTHGETNVGARAHIRGQSVPHALSSPQSADSLFGLQDVVGTPGAALCGLTLNYKTISQKAFELLLLPLSPDCTPPDVREENLFVELPDFGCTRVSSIIDDMAAGDNHAAPLCW